MREEKIDRKTDRQTDRQTFTRTVCLANLKFDGANLQCMVIRGGLC